MGELVIPVDEALAGRREARLARRRSAAQSPRSATPTSRSFPSRQSAFIAAGADEQRSQFILVNNTKPLPRDSSTNCCPTPRAPAAEVRPPAVAGPADDSAQPRLRDSPFRGAIATPTSPDGYIKDNSVLKMIENSLYDGALYQYRDPEDGSGDVEQMVLHLKIFWSLVESTWPIEWKLIRVSRGLLTVSASSRSAT